MVEDRSESTAVSIPRPEANGTMTVMTEGDMVASWDSKASAVRHSFPISDDAGRSKYMACLKPSDITGLDLAGKELLVSDWFMHVVELADLKSGECYKALRLVLLLSDGKIASTASPSLIGGWGSVVKLFSPWQSSPPLVVKIIKVKAKVQGHFLAIDTVQRASEPAVTKPAK